MRCVCVCLLSILAYAVGSLQASRSSSPADFASRTTRPVSDPLLGLTSSSKDTSSLHSLDTKIQNVQRTLDELSRDVRAAKTSIETNQKNIEQLLHYFIKRSCAELTGSESAPSDVASGHLSRQNSMDGVFAILPPTGSLKRVKCEHSSDGDMGWTVALLRQDGSVAFNRTLTEYEAGFGDPSGEVWIGLGTLHALTSTQEYQLRVELKDFAGKTAFAQYSSFRVGSSSESYKLTVGGYDRSSTAGDALADHNNALFSTFDSDKDSDLRNNCASQLGGGGGWWYVQCYHALGTGTYRRPSRPGQTQPPQAYGGITWHPFSNVKSSLPLFKMLIKPRDV
ncbi:Fibrinogen alpha/beta/gamma chain C-terminal globular domain [Trinorchestia longiramus]|nr:Fibrinogen alpha/beta/gamma chain C-terminal globular domain [Trinorchestia longiramus]